MKQLLRVIDGFINFLVKPDSMGLAKFCSVELFIE